MVLTLQYAVLASHLATLFRVLQVQVHVPPLPTVMQTERQMACKMERRMECRKECVTERQTERQTVVHLLQGCGSPSLAIRLVMETQLPLSRWSNMPG